MARSAPSSGRRADLILNDHVPSPASSLVPGHHGDLLLVFLGTSQRRQARLLTLPPGSQHLGPLLTGRGSQGAGSGLFRLALWPWCASFFSLIEKKVLLPGSIVEIK